MQRDQVNSIPGLSVVIVLLTLFIVIAMTQRLQRPLIWTVHGIELDEANAHLVNWPDGRIDVNSASAAQLCLLPGIGPALSERIVIDRKADGAYPDLETMKRVHMIGDRTVERIQPYSVVLPP